MHTYKPTNKPTTASLYIDALWAARKRNCYPKNRFLSFVRSLQYRTWAILDLHQQITDKLAAFCASPNMNFWGIRKITDIPALSLSFSEPCIMFGSYDMVVYGLYIRFRLHSHQLEIGYGRHYGTPRANRLCRCCYAQILEDERHFLLICRLYETFRTSFLLPGSEALHLLCLITRNWWAKLTQLRSWESLNYLLCY